MALSSITNVAKAPRGSNLFDGSLRRRLQVDHDGTIDYFVVPHVDAIVAAIQDALPAPAHP
jgi:hypothetical protein